MMSTPSEAETQRFYLRKIEGAEILLAPETNFFRHELHKWCPVAPEPPPVLDQSKSTRKPRPTKLQKMLAQYGVDDPDDLPENVKGKANSLKRKAQNAEAAAAAAAAASSGSSGAHATSPGANHFGAGHPFFSRHSSDQPQTPGLSIASSTHARPSRGPGSASSSHGHHGRSGSMHKDPLELDPVTIHPSFFMQDSAVTGPQVPLSMEDNLLRNHGHEAEEEVHGLTNGDAGKTKGLDSMLSRGEFGRRQAPDYGRERDVWGTNVVDDNDPLGIGAAAAGGDERIDQDSSMFADLVNVHEEDDDEHERRKGALDHSEMEATSLLDV